MRKKLEKPIIYMISFPNEKKYIGLTNTSLNHRQNEHLSKTRKGSKFAVHNALRKYGNSVIWEILCECSSYEEAKLKEIEYISKYNSNDIQFGYNLTKGGDGTVGYKITELHRKNLSEAHKGYKMPEKQKIAISKANKGRILTEKWKQNISNAQKGKSLESSHLANIRNAICVSIEVYNKFNKDLVGKWNSVTECAKDLNVLKTSIQNNLNGLSSSFGKQYFARRI